MTQTIEAIKYLDEALCLLTGEVYRVDMIGNETKMEGMCTIVLDLQRIDSAIGPKGESIFGKIADTIQAAYVEITAARAALASASASSTGEPPLPSPNYEKLLGELLAVIHRDDGHHEAENGTERAVKDAIDHVYDWLAQEEPVSPRATAPTHRDDVIEECAKRAQEVLDDAAGEREPFNPKCIPAHIRALKDSNRGERE